MLLAIALGAALSVPASFADPELLAVLGGLKPEPGAWVEYLVRSRGEGAARVRVTAFAAASDGGYWLEVATASESGIAGAARLLVHGDEVSPSGIERLYVMFGGQQPLQIPLDRLEAGLAPPRPAARVQRLGSARVRVAGGTFNAEVSRVAEITLWRTGTVPLWGLVKSRSRRCSVELLAWGASGGRSVFPPGWGQGNGSESAK